MNNIVKNRHELLFVYDVSHSNPNGDPMDENKPRIDEELGTNLVTDVRLKRTIRDEIDVLYQNDPNKNVFVKEVRDDKGSLKTKEERVKDINIKNADDMLNTCIDIRLFGGTTAIKKNTITFTGPIQFKMGYSLHKVSPAYIRGTTVMPSKAGLKQGTFREEYILPYSLILFYGIINENAAKTTQLSQEDVDIFFDAMWSGTKNLISRSKFGQIPRLMIDIIYQEPNFHLGELDKFICLEKSKRDEEIRDIKEVQIDIAQLISKLNENTDYIEKMRYRKDDRVTLIGNFEDFKGITEQF